MYPPAIQKLIDLFSKLPTVGPRTAARFVFYLMKLPKEKIEEFTKSIQNLKNQIKFCSFCFNPFEGKDSLCSICRNPTRNKKLLCVVEKETDLISIEKTKRYKGLFFILGGTVSTFKKTEVGKLRIKELQNRIKGFEEIILAFNPTPEGEATAVLVEKALKNNPVKGTAKITYLGKGLPVGGELEYADEETISSALKGRG